MSRKQKKQHYAPILSESAELWQSILPNKIIGFRIMNISDLAPGTKVNKLWIGMKTEAKEQLKTREIIKFGPYLGLTGDYFVQFEGSCCAYLASLCTPV